MSELAVKDCTISIKDTSISATSIQITTSPSSDNFVGDKGIYFGTISVTLSGLTKDNLVCATGIITVDGTCSDILDSSNKQAVQQGDSGSAELEFTDSSSGTTTPIVVEIEVSNAGQADVLT